MTLLLIAGDGRTCSFGDEDTRAENMRARRERIVAIEPSRWAVDLIYEGAPWHAPLLVQLPGVHLDAVRALDGEDPGRLVALVSLVDAAGRRCRRAPLRVDDDVAPGVAVLAILPTGFLVEQGGTLGFAAIDTRTVPPFRLVWRSSYSIIYESPSRPPPAPARPAPPRKR